ncbi:MULTISPECIES: methyltransferase domain-containing protein [unclassified Nocardiopsis]|uniref:methyltransferase domain-containing protein n=1 Tax=unclassified Nocardiopsis TaxID=2649073 RepID=UPI001356B2C5|nr:MULTISPECIES: methyltransferase domain-containing protein [unclassified Nocardiopsis]
MHTTSTLASGLADLFPAAWRQEANRVPRHLFTPDTVWAEDGNGPVPVQRHQDPQRWLELCYEDRPLVTQLDDGEDAGRGYITSSMSKPSIVAEMLEATDLASGQRVLEIGTGTGWNAALVAARVGAGNVVSVEVDPVLAQQAQRILAEQGWAVDVVTGDGLEGFAPGAPYDRVLSTAAVQQVPYAWVAQTRPGGIILTPWGTTFNNGVLARLTVGEDGTASGHFTGDAAFMWVRAQRRPHAVVEDLVSPGDEYAETTTELHPYEPIGDDDARFAIGLVLEPGASEVLVFDDDDPTKAYTVYLLAPTSESWASWRVEPGRRRHRVRQHGPRHLFDEVEVAYHRWVACGRPKRQDFGLTIMTSGQRVWWQDTHGVRHHTSPDRTGDARARW